MARIKIGNVRTPIEYLKQFFAPAGYGLGTVGGESKWNGDANTLTNQGWYRLETGTTNGVGASASLRVDGYTTTGLTQTAYTRTGFIMQRTCKDGTWDEWEWVNPPMFPGMEYRTTERYMGKVVYRKLVSFNLASAASSGFVVPHGISGFERLVRQMGTVNSNFPLPYILNGKTTWVSEVNATNIVVSNTGQVWDTSYTWYFDLYYTKN